MTQQFFVNATQTKILVLSEEGIEVFSLHAHYEGAGMIEEKEDPVAEYTARVVKSGTKVKYAKKETGNKSDAQVKIIELLNAGVASNDIAARLSCSIGTVYTTKSWAKKEGLLNIPSVIAPAKKPVKNDRYDELVRAYGKTKVDTVRNCYQLGETAQEIADDIDIGLDLHHVQTIIDRLEL